MEKAILHLTATPLAVPNYKPISSCSKKPPNSSKDKQIDPKMTAEKDEVAASGGDPPKYGTFQGAANYSPQPAVGFPQPAPPPGATGHYAHGYQTVPGYVVAQGTPGPAREGRLPCCGCGLGWCLFIIGFFLAGIPWYCGAIILLCVRTVDFREKPGYIACTIAAVLATIAGIIGGASQA